ncbi:hypothetical protein MATL_G00231460 [Megalops atlanticus]|uniref:Uncharacterized protein n=1 Tax=Megalops atlanticus TaxID=7932 RepID=A0A9D3PI31_MEGAT|nr:hypothetical protein MATL_G00231460 [Megalops atlanticus]
MTTSSLAKKSSAYLAVVGALLQLGRARRNHVVRPEKLLAALLSCDAGRSGRVLGQGYSYSRMMALCAAKHSFCRPQRSPFLVCT